jgi:hypothetical protein
MPQLEQKVAPAGCSNPQAGQVRWSAAPHSLQKRAPLEFSAPQEAQTNATRRVYAATAKFSPPRPTCAVAAKERLDSTRSVQRRHAREAGGL